MQTFNDESSGAAGRGSASRPRVLVAEDHEDTRSMLRLALEGCGCEVFEAADGEEAVRLADSARPDLLLLDLSLPLVDGLNVTRRVRSGDGDARVPIIFLSGHAEASVRSEAFKAGCDDYLVKPIELDRLNAVVTRHLARRTRPRESSRGLLPV